MGIFDIFNKKPISASKMQREQADKGIAAHIEHQDELIKVFTEAKELYKTDLDISAMLSVCERVLINDHDPLTYPNFQLFYADLLVKNGENDKAWGYLNSLIASCHSTPVSDIRNAQAKILKKEKKHIQAIEMYLRANADRGQYFNRTVCLKDIGVSIRALKWSSDMQTAFADMAEQASKANNPDKEVIRMYREYVKSHNLLEGGNHDNT